MSILLSTLGVISLSLTSSSNLTRSITSSDTYITTENKSASNTNNNIDDAHSLLRNDFLEKEKASTTLYGNVHNKALIDDIDYFYFYFYFYLDYKSDVKFTIETSSPAEMQSFLLKTITTIYILMAI